MKKYITHYSIAITLFFASIASAMDHPSLTDAIAESRNLPIPTNFPSTAQNSFVRIAAQEHNKNIPLVTLPKELLGSTLVNKNKSIIQSINDILSLSATCTLFNKKLEELGKMLQCYDQETKNSTLEKILLKINASTYQSMKRSALLLVYAGAEHNTCHSSLPLLNIIVKNNEIDMLATLFRYGANPNLKNLCNEPVFFESESLEMAQLFLNNGADLNITDNAQQNVLHCCLTLHEDKPELIEFYIDKGVNPKILDWKKQSLLHYIAFAEFEDDSVELKMVTLLLDTIGDMINTTDDDGKTPLDLLTQSLFFRPNIIALFKEYGAKTSQELKLIEHAKKKGKTPTVSYTRR